MLLTLHTQRVVVILLALALSACQIETLPTQQGNDSNSHSDAGSQNGDSGPSTDLPTNPKDVMVYWQAPTARHNGIARPRGEIGGYELRYRAGPDAASYRSIIMSPGTHQYLISDHPQANDLMIEVAVFDTNGVYSDFVAAIPK